MKDDVPDNAIILGGRFVLALRNAGTSKELCKARFVVQGSTDYEKNLLVHSSTNVRQRSIRMLIGIAAILEFWLRTQDISQAYLQSSSKLSREVYVKPENGINLKRKEPLKLLKPLYGLSDSGDYRRMTMKNHLVNNLKMRSLKGDLAYFIKCK